MYKHKKLLKMSKKARDGLRVSGGHLCVAEATTEPVGETSNPKVNCSEPPINKGVLAIYPDK